MNEIEIIKRISCPACLKPMLKVKWELTNGLETYNVYLQVEKFVLRCMNDNTTITLEIPTGKSVDFKE